MKTKELAQKILDLRETSEDMSDFVDNVEELCESVVEEYDTPEEVVVDGWVARNNCSALFLYMRCPKRDNREDKLRWYAGGQELCLHPDSFPSVTWESKPKRVKITITSIEE